MVVAMCISKITGKTESAIHSMHNYGASRYAGPGFSGRREGNKSMKVTAGKMKAVKGMESNGGVILQLILS